jgi:hypothetical protein
MPRGHDLVKIGDWAQDFTVGEVIVTGDDELGLLQMRG